MAACPLGSRAMGYKASEPRLTFVRKMTSMKYDISWIGLESFGDIPDLAVQGPYVSPVCLKDVHNRLSEHRGCL
jgi:hypothetical protein